MSEKQPKGKMRRAIGKLEKSAMIAHHMKSGYTQAKDKAVHSVYAEENSPTEYAAELLERGEDKIVHAGSIAGQKAAEAYVKRKRLKKVRKESVLKRRPPVVYGNQFPKQEVKNTVEQSAKKTTEHASRALPIAGQRAGTLAKASWQKRKQIELAVEKTTNATTFIGEKISLLFTSSLKVILKASQELFLALGIGGTFIVGLLIILIMTSSAFLFWGDGINSEYTPVIAEVQQYDPLIRLYADKYDMMDYVDLIKAVMMQESGGRGKDPMQASEGSFNTRYPREPNGITDPEYSISCGVQELKAALTSAGVESPVDMTNIKLALQGYNYGNGYISWAIEKDGGYTKANAIEFSEMMAERFGWERYGDKEYVAHVLRYYPFTGMASGAGSSDIVSSALSQLGIVGGRPYWRWYGFNSRVEWCACFVSWCANECGYISDGTILKFSYCQTGANWFKSKHQWQSKYYTPAGGDIIFFDWEGDGHTDHVGIVEKCEGNRVYTIEGNSGDAVRKRSYAVGSNLIYGYGVPAH